MKCYKLFSVQAIIAGLLLSTPSFAGVTDDAIASALEMAEVCLEGGDSEVVLDILNDINHTYGAAEEYMMFAERHEDLKKQAIALRNRRTPISAAAVAPSEEKRLAPAVVTYSPSRYVVHSFRELLDHERLAPGAILTIDVDATLLHKKREMNSEQAMPEMSTRYANFLDAVERKFGEEALFSFMGAGGNSPMRTEDDIPNILAEVSRRGVLLVPFTARQHTDAAETEELLNNLGYRFANWNQGKASIPDNFYDGVTVVNGMIFATKGHKDAGHKDRASQALIRHYEINGNLPTAFGHIDDTEEHLNQMAGLIQTSPRPLSLIHYQGGKHLDRKEKVKDHLKCVVQNFDQYEDLFDRAFN